MINRPALKMLKDLHDLVGVEIGVSSGANALNIAENLDIRKLYLVDPYIEYEHYKQENIDVWKEKAHHLLEKYSDRIIWVEKISKDAAADIPNGLDFVYIDGSHLYEVVLNDIGIYYKKVKSGRLIGGHDMDVPTVKLALITYFKDKNVLVYCYKCDDTSYDWWVIT